MRQKMQIAEKKSTFNKKASQLQMLQKKDSSPDKTTPHVVTILNNLLANEFSLFTKTLNYHWNVTGRRFHAIHILLEEQYRDLLQVMDDVAERVRILDCRPLSTVSEMFSATTLQESPGKVPTSDEMLADLLKGHVAVQRFLKDSVEDDDVFEEDPASQDFLIQLLAKHEKMAWMIRAQLIDEGGLN